MALVIRPVEPRDRAEWGRMRCALWPGEDPEELGREAAAWQASDREEVFVAEGPGGRLCGFVETSLRPCDVNGRPAAIGYIEAWYVEPNARRRGAGRSLVEAAERWARERGCTEMHSDAHLHNALSHTAHGALGYKAFERLVHFRKQI